MQNTLRHPELDIETQLTLMLTLLSSRELSTLWAEQKEEPQSLLAGAPCTLRGSSEVL